MSLSSILALVDPKHGAATLSTASRAAEKLDAPIDVLIARRDPADAIPMVGEGLSGALVDQIMNAAAADAATDAAACQTLIEAWPGNAGANVLDLIGSRRSLIAETGRTYGMTVLPCPNGPEGGGFDGIVDAALFETGRPILIAPLHEVKSLGDRVAIFWNDSAESARAVWGAVPLLRQAGTVNIFTVGEGFNPESALARISAGLNRAGIRAEAHAIPPKGMAQDQLIDAAAAMDADLVVMGAFTHSRLRELVLGGVTQHMLEVLARPTFMAH